MHTHGFVYLLKDTQEIGTMANFGRETGGRRHPLFLYLLVQFQIFFNYVHILPIFKKQIVVLR